MHNNGMPRMKTSIKLPFSVMDEAGAAWPMLVVFLRMASEYPYGIVPPRSLTLARVRRVFAAPDEEILQQAKKLCHQKMIVYVTYRSTRRGNGWEKGTAVDGWYSPSWPSVCADKRRISRSDIEVHDGAALFSQEAEALTDKRSDLASLEEAALGCMSVGGRRGRTLVLDGISRNWLVKLYEEHGFEVVKSALTKCAGASRPVAMAKKILKKSVSGRGKAVPTADEWRDG
jgi:hypothetical protein